MVDTLNRHLSQLNDLVESTTAQRGLEAGNIVGDLAIFCLESVTDAQLAYCSSLLFHEADGIISFLRKTIPLDEFVDAKTELLRFLIAYVQKIDKNVSTYAVDIKEVCVSLFTRERSSKVKNGTFPVLIQLMELKLDNSVIESMNIPKLIEKYFNACMQPSKHTSTVKCGIYSLLGTFAKVFPELMISYADRLVSIYCSVLKTEMGRKDKKPDMQIITGCLRGLTSLLYNFTQSVEEGSSYAEQIYRYSKMAINPQTQLSVYDVPKAGLWLFAKHSAQFKEYITKDHEELYRSFLKWSCHGNKDVKIAGLSALESFFKQVSEYLFNKAEEVQSGINDNAIFKDFIRRFRSIIDNPESTTREMSIAIRGYGYFSKPCKIFMKEADVKFMFNEMIQRSEQLCFGNAEFLDDTIQHLPSFLEALACIVEELDELSDTFLVSVEKLVVVMFESYPRMGKGPQFQGYKAFIKLFIAMMPKGVILKNFLSHVVYQGLIRTCSHAVVLEEAETDEEEMDQKMKGKKVSYKDYIELWTNLLDTTRFKELKAITAMENGQVLKQMIYDELVQAILRITKNLILI